MPKCIKCKNETIEHSRCDSCLIKARVWNKKSKTKRGHLWGKKPEQIERRDSLSKLYWEQNKEILKPLNRERNRNWYKTIGRIKNEKPEWRYKTYQSSARRTNRKFDLTYEQFMSFVVCLGVARKNNMTKIQFV